MKTTKRFEYKYLISYVDYFKVIDSLRFILNHDKHGDELSYGVNSLYLDDLVFNGASDKAFGNEVHKKYRIRYYNDFNKKKLELKIKSGHETEKLSTVINEEIYDAIIDRKLSVLEKYFDDVLIRRFTLDFLKSYLHPVCMIKYNREAYKDESDNLRVTFDHSLNVSRFEKGFEDMNLKLLSDSMLILEIKYEHYLPRHIKELLNKLNLNQIAYSKYFMGFNSLEF
jgi:hypothetical protein